MLIIERLSPVESKTFGYREKPIQRIGEWKDEEGKRVERVRNRSDGKSGAGRMRGQRQGIGRSLAFLAGVVRSGVFGPGIVGSGKRR
jgi:hypothetical protein